MARAVVLASAILASLGAFSAPCPDAEVILLHPPISRVYQEVISTIADGLRAGGIRNLAVCESGQTSSISPRTSVVFTIGEETPRSLSGGAGYRAVSLLTPNLESPAKLGLSVHLDPSVILEKVVSLRRGARKVYMVHLARTAKSVIDRAQSAAARYGISFEDVSVSDVRDAAKAIEGLKRLPKGSIAWFQRGVLGLNPDILVPNLVRLSWELGIISIATEAKYVERGVMIAATHDYKEFGRRAARALANREKGLVYSREARWMLNRRSASALGISLPSSQEREFDVVYE